jgi:hypothetical protein
MTIERPRPAVFRVTLHAYEMAALVAAARWVAEGARGELPAEAVQQIRQVLAGYEDALGKAGRDGSQ